MNRTLQMFGKESVFTFVAPSNTHWDDDDNEIEKEGDDSYWTFIDFFVFVQDDTSTKDVSASYLLCVLLSFVYPNL